MKSCFIIFAGAWVKQHCPCVKSNTILSNCDYQCYPHPCLYYTAPNRSFQYEALSDLAVSLAGCFGALSLLCHRCFKRVHKQDFCFCIMTQKCVFSCVCETEATFERVSHWKLCPCNNNNTTGSVIWYGFTHSRTVRMRTWMSSYDTAHYELHLWDPNTVSHSYSSALA